MGKHETFRFVSLREADQPTRSNLEKKYIRDSRDLTLVDPFAAISAATGYPDKYEVANTFEESSNFLTADDLYAEIPEAVITFLREITTKGVTLTDVYTPIETKYPSHPLVKSITDPSLNSDFIDLEENLWDALYARTVIGGNRFTTTQYLVDGIRAVHLFKLIFRHRTDGHTEWKSYDFEEYEPVISSLLFKDPVAAGGSAGGNGANGGSDPIGDKAGEIHMTATQYLATKTARHEVEALLEKEAWTTLGYDQATGQVIMDPATLGHLSFESRMTIEGMNLQDKPIDVVQEALERESFATTMKLTQIAGTDTATQVQRMVNENLQFYAASNPETMESTYISLMDDLCCTLEGCEHHEFINRGCIKPVSVGDLVRVEQELLRYELGEVASIENVMASEKMERTTRNLDRLTRTYEESREDFKETQSSRETDERHKLTTAAQETLKRDFSIEGKAAFSFEKGPFKISTSVGASYNNSKSSSRSTNTEFATQVTEKASEIVRKNTKSSSIITFFSERQDTSLHGFDNSSSMDHVVGIYRWLEKVYKMQTANYGKRLMLEFNVPEPGMFYRNVAQSLEANATGALKKPIPPSELNGDMIIHRDGVTCDCHEEPVHSFQDIDEYNYAMLASRYEILDISPPPPKYVTIGMPFTFPEDNAPKEHGTFMNKMVSQVKAERSLSVPDGYALSYLGCYNPTHPYFNNAMGFGYDDGATGDSVGYINVQVGHKKFEVRAEESGGSSSIVMNEFNQQKSFTQSDPSVMHFRPSYNSGPIPVTVSMSSAGFFSFNIVGVAKRLHTTWQKWQQETYAMIVQGYNAKLKAFELAKQATEYKQERELEEKNVTRQSQYYRDAELTELKKHCLTLLTKRTAHGYTSVTPGANSHLEIVMDPERGARIPRWRSPFSNGIIAQFFEQAFEWNQTFYEFYPYFWTDKNRWEELVNMESVGDPLFDKFLSAGSSRVVIPVSPNYEESMLFFLKTGLIWTGGKLPAFEEEAYLSILEEVKSGIQLAKGEGETVGEPWEVSLPTNLIMLQADSILPTFTGLPTGGTDPVDLEEESEY